MNGIFNITVNDKSLLRAFVKPKIEYWDGTLFVTFYSNNESVLRFFVELNTKISIKTKIEFISGKVIELEMSRYSIDNVKTKNGRKYLRYRLIEGVYEA